MYCRKSRPLIAAICLSSLYTLSLGSFPELVLAENFNTPRQGLPGRRVGGGSRGNCNFGEQMLTALIPKNNLGLTVAGHPKFFFYIPQTTNSQVVEFVLRDETDRQIYETTFKTNGTSGVISLSLPNSAPLKALEIGKKYQWYFSIICNPQNRANDVSVDGWIQRVKLSPTLTSELEKVAPRGRAALYATAGIWHEALTTLAALRHSRPDDSTIAAEWAQLLQSVGLDNIAQEPFKANYPVEHRVPNKLDVGTTVPVSVLAGRDAALLL